MDNYLKNWNFMRLLRLALGIIIMVQGALSKEWIFVAMGALLTLMPWAVVVLRVATHP